MEKPDEAGPGECPCVEYINRAGRSPTYGTTWFYSQRHPKGRSQRIAGK
jgi:hypothetical protein